MSFLNISDIIKFSVARGGSLISIYNVRAWLIHEKVAENSYQNQRDQAEWT